DPRPAAEQVLVRGGQPRPLAARHGMAADETPDAQRRGSADDRSFDTAGVGDEDVRRGAGHALQEPEVGARRRGQDNQVRRGYGALDGGRGAGHRAHPERAPRDRRTVHPDDRVARTCQGPGQRAPDEPEADYSHHRPHSSPRIRSSTSGSRRCSRPPAAETSIAYTAPAPNRDSGRLTAHSHGRYRSSGSQARKTNGEETRSAAAMSRRPSRAPPRPRVPAAAPAYGLRPGGGTVVGNRMEGKLSTPAERSSVTTVMVAAAGRSGSG